MSTDFSILDRASFGRPEGIERRLAMWAKRLGMDKTLPWVGMGMIADMKCACAMLGGDPENGVPMPTMAPKMPPSTQSTEYDL